MDILEIRSILREYNIVPNKLKGQNFLIQEDAARRIVEEVRIRQDERVLEIGPGLGALTQYLLETGAEIIAIEREPTFVKILQDRFHLDKLELIEGDVLKIDIPDFDVVVSNVPYVISSPLTFRLLEKDFKRGVLTYQEEFAQRMVAEPGDYDYSRLSVSLRYHAQCEILFYLSPNAFYPVPKVRSAVVGIKRTPPPIKVDEARFNDLVRGLFTVRRKTLGKAIKIAKKVSGIEVDKSRIPEEMLEKRVYELSLEEIAGLTKL